MTVLVRNMVEQFIPGSEGSEPPLSMPSTPVPANDRAAKPPEPAARLGLPDAVAGVEADARFHADLPRRRRVRSGSGVGARGAASGRAGGPRSA